MPNKEIYTDNIEIRQRLDARTPGKWSVTHWAGGLNFNGPPIVVTNDHVTGYGEPPIICRDVNEADADFIAHAPDDMRLLLEKHDVLKSILNVAYKILLDIGYSEMSEEVQQKIYKNLCLMEEILNKFKEKYENE